MMKLDLASGQAPAPGYKSVDIDPQLEPDFCVNLFETPWPLDSDSVDRARCSHFVEHVPDLVGFMNELGRVMKDGGKVHIIHPYQFSIRAWQDPTHVRALNEASWLYYDANWRRENRLSHYAITCDFEIEEIIYALSSEYEGQEDSPMLRAAMAHQVNVVDDLHVRLICHKDRQ